jgi:hypothetical protein
MADIANTMGGFEHCADGGRNAVMGQVKRLRDAAKKRGDEVETVFWSRESSKSGRKKSKAGRSSSARTMDKPIPHNHDQAFIDSVQPARLKPNRDPAWKGSAFPLSSATSKNPDDLPADIIAAIASMYPKD